MSDIVDELRNDQPGEQQHHREARALFDGMHDRAADEITRLRAENERIRDALKNTSLYLAQAAEKIEQLSIKNERLRAENERVRKALTQIALHYDRIYYPGELSFEFAKIARAALNGESNAS